MKITIVLGAFFPVPPLLGGGVEKVSFLLAQEFVRQGHTVVQISRTYPGLPRNEIIEGVQHVRVRGYAQPHSIVWLKWLDLLYSLRVRRILPPADILVTNTFWLPLLVRQKDRGLLCLQVQRGPKGQMRFYSRAARLSAVSRAIADEIVKQAPALRDKVKVIPNPLPFRMDDAIAQTREPTILYVGRVHPEKGIELLLRALAFLPNDIRARWKLKVVGPHEVALGGGGEAFLKTLQELAARSGMTVEWRGAVFDLDALAAEYRASSVFVYPSIAEAGEAFGVASIEAMAYGSIPLVSDLACFRDFIANNQNGFVFDHRAQEREKNLADRLTSLLQFAPSRVAALREAARAKAAEFDVTRVAQRYLEDFASLLKNVA